jgi:hypothetical protein
MWEWLSNLSQGQATFLGWVVGFFTLVGGALFNAHLNRRRDDRLRREDRRAVATALKAELEGLIRTLLENAEDLQLKKMAPDEGVRVPDLAQLVRIMPHMVPKFGLLDQETIQSVGAAYSMVEQYYAKLVMAGGRQENLTSDAERRFVWFSADKVSTIIKLNEVLAKVIQEATAKLDTYAENEAG